MKKHHLLTLLFSCLCLLAWADRVDQRVAQEIAQTVAKSYRQGSLRTSTHPPKLVYAAAAGAEGTALRSGTAPDQADYYVFNIGTEDGFVIVAGEDRVLPVLGYAEKGTFDPDHLPDNLRGMLAYYQQEIDLAVHRNLTATETVQAAWSRLTSGLGLRTGSSSEVVRLETAQWGQSTPYNNQTPTISGQHALTGCVATSLGTLLQYCQYPSQLTGGIDSYYEIPISYGTYDWSKMPKSRPATTDEIEQVSSLLWHIGANVSMEYGLEASSASNSKALDFLHDQAQFNPGSRFVERENYYWSEWKEMIRTTLRGESGQGYPLIYCGNGSAGGHMFLIDGFGPDEYFHINWGWEGYCDGNYVLTALNTNAGSFSDNMGMIHNAVPNTVANEDVIELRYQSLTFGTTFSTTDPFSVKFQAVNTGSYTSDYPVGIGLFDENGTMKKTIHTADQICRMPANSYYVFTVPCLIDESLSATDQIAPVYKAHSDDTEWKRMPNAPTAARYITSTGDLFTDTDNDTDPALAPIVLTRNDLPDAYFNISALTDDLYNEPKEIILNLAGHSGTKILRFQLQGYDAWQGHLRAWYSDGPFYEGTEAAKLEIDNNGQFSIKLEDGTYGSSQSIYIMMGSDQQGTLGYKMEILDEASGNVQFSMDNGNIHFILKMALEMSPITGIAKQDIPVTATLSNIDPLLYGKAATVVIVVPLIGSHQMQFYYEGALLDSENQYNSLVVPIPIEALPNAPKLEIPYTLRVAEEVTAEENLQLYGYVSGFQGNWIAQSVVIGPAEIVYHSVTSSLTGLNLTTESEMVAHGGTYEGVLSLTDATLTKLPQQITVTTADNAETWTDFMYEPSTGSIVIRNVTEDLFIQATAESLTSYSIKTELSNDMRIDDLPAGDIIQEGQTLRFTLTAQAPSRLPATIQVKSNGEALSTDAYTYDTSTGVVEIPSVQGNITVVASAIGVDCHEVVLQLTNLTSTLGTTSFRNGSDVHFRLRPHAGYTLPASLTVTLNGTTLTADDGYVYKPSEGSFTFSSIKGTLSITGAAVPMDYGEATFDLTHITVGDGHTEKAIHGMIYECQLTADEGYELPNSLQVKMNDVLLNSGYTYENGLLQILSVTGPITITAAATIRTYAVSSKLENMTSDLTPDLKVAHGDPLTVHLSAADGYSLPRSVSVQINGTDLTEGEGYTYVDGVLTIASVTGPVNISASAILGIVVTDSDNKVQGSIPAVHVETEGDASLSLNALKTGLLEISSNSIATLSVTANSKILSLENVGTLSLTSEGDATLEVQSISNSGVMVLQEGLKLTSTLPSVINEGSFIDSTGMIQKVDGVASLEIQTPLLPATSCTQGVTLTLTVKVLVTPEREKTIFEWQQKADDSWVTVQTDSQEGSPLRSDGADELTSNYSFTPTQSGIYRCVITNYKSEEMQTTLMTEISVTVSTPIPDPDPDPLPDPVPDPDPIPVPDPDPDPVKLYRVTLPLVKGTAVETYGSTYVRKGKSFSFRINIADGYNAKDMVVKANGTVLLPDATGLYVIEDIQEDVVVTITGIVKESPSAIEGPGYTMTSVWTGQGQIHIQLGKDATVTVSDYSGRIVKTFKGKVGDYHISIHKGSYVVSVDGLTYKVVL